MFRCDIPDADLVFGQHARERALAAKQRECEMLLQQLQDHQKQLDALLSLYKSVSDTQAISYATLMQDMLDIQRQLKRAEQALAQLDERDRQIVLLSEYAGFDTAELAGLLRIAPGTVGSRKHGALARLRWLLKEEGDG